MTELERSVSIQMTSLASWGIRERTPNQILRFGSTWNTPILVPSLRKLVGGRNFETNTAIDESTIRMSVCGFSLISKTGVGQLRIYWPPNKSFGISPKTMAASAFWCSVWTGAKLPARKRLRGDFGALWVFFGIWGRELSTRISLVCRVSEFASLERNLLASGGVRDQR